MRVVTPLQRAQHRFYGRIIRLGVSPQSIAWRVLGCQQQQMVLQSLIGGWISRTPWEEFRRDIADGSLVCVNGQQRKNRQNAWLQLVKRAS